MGAGGAILARESQRHPQLGTQSEVPCLLHNLGYVALQRGDREQAWALFRDNLSRFAEVGMTRGSAEALAGCAAVAVGRAAEAARRWGAAATLHAVAGTLMWPADRREQ